MCEDALLCQLPFLEEPYSDALSGKNCLVWHGQSSGRARTWCRAHIGPKRVWPSSQLPSFPIYCSPVAQTGLTGHRRAAAHRDTDFPPHSGLQLRGRWRQWASPLKSSWNLGHPCGTKSWANCEERMVDWRACFAGICLLNLSVRLSAVRSFWCVWLAHVGSRERMRKECTRVIVIPKTWALMSFMMSCFSRWIDFASAWLENGSHAAQKPPDWSWMNMKDTSLYRRPNAHLILGGWSNSLCPWFDPSNPHGTARASASPL